MAEVEGDYGGATVVERMVLLPKGLQWRMP
jgi:hypothetical protein